MTPEASFKDFMKEYDDIPMPEGVLWKGRRAYLVPERLGSFTENIKAEAFSIGSPLGEDSAKGFRPSFALLDLLKTSKNRIIISDDAEFLFTCGRDAFMDKVLYEGELKGRFLVTNKRGEVLGIGRFERKGKDQVVKNLYDRGDFLRREEKRKKRKKR